MECIFCHKKNGRIFVPGTIEYTMKQFAAFILLLLLASSCKYLDFRLDDSVVAQVGKYRLYKTDVQNLIPAGTPAGDSIQMLRTYVDSWAIKYLLITKAEQELSKEQKDMEQEMEDYRNSLIAFRYEKLFIENRLDTVVTESESREYFMANSNNIRLTNSVVKGRVIKISSGSPNLERIRTMYQAASLEEIDELERVCYNSADRYNNFGNQWTDLGNVARELPLDLYSCEIELKNKNHLETRDSLYVYLAFFSEIIPPGGTPPYEFYLPRIKENIVGKRKQDLIKQLEKDLLRDALQNNTIKTNINDLSKNENQR